MTSFDKIYNCFFGKITDDLYIELTPEDTQRDAKSLLLQALPYFEFPHFNINAYDAEAGTFEDDLTDEDINILAICMKQGWLERQISSIENTRMKYSGSDFKMTSQANHLAKLLTLKAENHRESIHAQRLYNRRKITNGKVSSNWNILLKGGSPLDNQ